MKRTNRHNRRWYKAVISRQPIAQRESPSFEIGEQGNASNTLARGRGLYSLDAHKPAVSHAANVSHVWMR